MPEALAVAPVRFPGYGPAGGDVAFPQGDDRGQPMVMLAYNAVLVRQTSGCDVPSPSRMRHSRAA